MEARKLTRRRSVRQSGAQEEITLAKLGFIGTGTIGNPIAARLLAAGHELVVTDAARAATANLEERGARYAPSPRAVAQECAVVFSSLPGPAQVRAVVEGPDGVLAAQRRASCTSISRRARSRRCSRCARSRPRRARR
jgi:3-hydroxyisobutyrate dehydrogenase-like beta-hydroxyacid dehydrogenase